MMFQVISMAGAVLILIAYGASQANRLPVETLAYQLLNVGGAACLLAAAIAARQYGFILLEGAWTVVSILGLAKVARKTSARS